MAGTVCSQRVWLDVAAAAAAGLPELRSRKSPPADGRGRGRGPSAAAVVLAAKRSQALVLSLPERRGVFSSNSNGTMLSRVTCSASPHQVVGEPGLFTPADIKVVQDAGVGTMMKVAGVQIPVRSKQRLQSSRRTKRVTIDKTPVKPPRATHKLLRVMAGRCAGKKLISPSDAQVRPMMEVVRGAVFNILKSLESWNPSSPSGRWLDLYSGTGSVAIEAMSRGCCAEAHFVEVDPWVITNVLFPNLEETNCHNQTVVHTSKVETLLEQASKRGAECFGGAFDYVSVTPPYEAVSYTDLMAQLSASPLLSESTFMVVEYPIKSKHEMPDSCGALTKIKDRKYGRTHVAVYGPQWLERDEPKVKRGANAI